MIRSTHTYAILEVSRAAYTEIKEKLEGAGYSDQFHDDGDRDGVVIDMHGIALKIEEGRKMQPHQQRVVDERADISDRLDKLEEFHNGAIYARLPPAEQSRLTRQLYIMRLYEQVLSERISSF